MVVLLDKLKDKNRAVVDAVHCTLDIFLLVSPLLQCVCVSFVVLKQTGWTLITVVVVVGVQRKCTTLQEIAENVVAALGKSSTPKVCNIRVLMECDGG